MKIKKEMAICAGLWFAEGDKKCKNEINFCNNCFELIDLFDKTIRNLFSDYNFNVRIYVYTSNKTDVEIPIEDCVIRRYVDKLARRPYFIWRLASVKLNKKWKELVTEIQQNPVYCADFLTGFFAGEGNVKTGKQGCRTLRIAQKNESELISNMLQRLGISYSFREKERNYYISHKDNWDKFAKQGLANLHPIKQKQFLEAYTSFKENHYRNSHLQKEILKTLEKPFTSRQLADKFNRSQARVQDVLVSLKKQGILQNFRVRSKDYWIKKKKKVIIISAIKQKYLKALATSKSTKELATKFNVCWKAAFRRLKELENLGLAIRCKNKQWMLKPHKQKVIVK